VGCLTTEGLPVGYILQLITVVWWQIYWSYC